MFGVFIVDLEQISRKAPVSSLQAFVLITTDKAYKEDFLGG